jgi:DNA-directed RNA polymerase subunit RPC12/RpoP
MESKAHSRKVAAKAAERQAKSSYRCSNCGETFVSKAEKESHERKHGKPRVRGAA